MNTRFFIFLFVILFSLKLWANPLFLNPNLGRQPLPISAGTQLQPLCFGPPSQCIQQWSQQAFPMAVYSNTSSHIPSQYQFFLPAILPSDAIYENPEGDKNWKALDSYSSSSDDDKSSPRYYINNSDNSEIRVVSYSNGQSTVQGGTVLFVPQEHLSFTNSIQSEGGTQTTSIDPVVESSTPTVTVEKDTFGFQGTQGEGTGCFTPGENPVQTEAGFCFNCDRENLTENNNILSQLAENSNFWDGIADFLNKATHQAKKKVRLAGVGVTEDYNWTKICSPNIALKALINNFNRDCPMSFDKFFNSAYCESCKQSIPPEIMFALMSIESSASCPARAQNELEDSFGLFQINSQEHGCRDHSTNQTYNKNTKRSRECLKNPVNNLMKSVDILKDYYTKLNPEPPTKSEGCQPWSQMDNKKKDHWRKGVAAYNSGPGWVTRAIKSVKVRTSNYNTEMTGSHTGNKWKKAMEKYKNEDPSWEEMRVYFFTEKLIHNPSLRMPERGVKLGDKLAGERGSGRRLSLTLNNIAYTEAILGRNADKSYPGMVDIWEQYIAKNQPKCEE